MTTPVLHLTNTLTRQKQPFIPLAAGRVGMYVCGITPYDDAHIGHARASVVFDVLYRLLRHIYGEGHVTYVRNFTDIDDKIIQRAAERGEPPQALAERYIASFHEDMDALNILRPTAEPRVSASLPGIVAMVDELLAKGFAYVTPAGDVMYRTARFPAFGQLARRRLDEQLHGARVSEDAEKESPSDFVLWKANAKSATKLEQAFKPSDFGAKHFAAPGRPGWHIECSVMSREALGLPFDIHGGGEDLIFPHHCCEIAQSEALLAPGQPMARYWVHNSFITVNGTKMSKSLGNFTAIKDVLEKYNPQALRLWLLQTHYRKPVDYSEEALNASRQRALRWHRFSEENIPNENLDKVPLPSKFIEALADDLNTSEALAFMEGWENRLEKLAMMKFLGILSRIQSYEMTPDQLELVCQRRQARINKDWPESDRLRDVLLSKHGIVVEDHKDGTTTYRPA